ncbi:MAG: TauD/TfdA family dioxygenase [Alphaproteobacteria bacterium]|nr:TauD/TfdA family dioxygenase [Alphaproteobacteria bacterium]
MTYRFEPVDGTFACEVHGLSLWQPLDDAAVAQIAERWSNQGVLIFRRQSLSEAELVTFSRRFGDPDVIVRTDWQAATPEVVQISNMKDSAGRSIGGLGAGELGWHTDQSYVADPATGSVLYMVEMPRDGGRTYWANLQLAYDALPEKTKTRIDGMSGVYDYVARQSTYDDEPEMSEELRRKTPPVTHPLVNRHPVTGKKSLYLDPTTSVGIAELPGAQGRALLDELNEHATQPDFVYAHEWQIGDVVMWDNGFLLHRRDPFDAGQNRLLKRTTLRLSPAHHIVPPSTLIAA